VRTVVKPAPMELEQAGAADGDATGTGGTKSTGLYTHKALHLYFMYF